MADADLGRSATAGAGGFVGPLPPSLATTARGTLRRLAEFLRNKDDAGAARRLAGGAFAMRVLNAGLGFATQIVLARWMGGVEYGIYAYLWVCLLCVGGIGSLGLPVAALKFVPDYGLRGDLTGLRGFLHHARLGGVLPSAAFAVIAGLALIVASRLLGDREGAAYVPVALLTLAILPVYVLTDIQTGIARAYDFADLGLAADYLVRPLLLLGFVAALAASGGPSTALAVMAATLAAVVLTALVQGILLQGRLDRRIPTGPRRSDAGTWARVSAPLLAVTGFTLLLGSTDILLLRLFVGPEEIARYFAATKILAIASFVAYGVAATSSHRFAAQAVSGERGATARLAAETVRWTFWPTLAVILGLVALGRPLLSLFGPDYAAAWPVIAILSLGLLAQASIGPADRALAMLDHGGVTARIYALSVAVNVAFGLALIPIFGLTGAALATSLALGVKSGMLYLSARRRLGLDMFVLSAGREEARAGAARPTSIRAEIVTPAQAEGEIAAWSDLAERSLEPNGFYAPGLALAGLRHLPEGRSAAILMAWREVDGGRRLVGLMPIVRPRGRYFNPFGIRRAAELYGTLSTPLVDAECAPEALAAMLHALQAAGCPGLLLPFLHEDGAVAAALDEAVRDQNLTLVRFDGHSRAMLRSPLRGADYVRATLETRRRKEADRQRRRLAETGKLDFRVLSQAADIADALEDFLALEAAGWKGKRGTDLRSAPGGLAFIRDAAAALADRGSFRIATLTLDGRVVAAGRVLVAGRRAFYMKTAYDESLARFSPGLLLTLDLTAHLLDDPAIDDADSIAVADHPMIDRVWTERFPVASVLVSTAPGGGLEFRVAAAFDRMREDVRLRSRPLRAKLSNLRASPGKDISKNTGASSAD